jgi:predicted O-methyltransferase YrrM
MELVSKTAERYAEEHTSAEDPVLYEIWRQTNLKTFYPNMVSGKVQGQLLKMIVQMLRPQRILEIGTFTGYSAVAMAMALPDGGKLITIDNNEEIETLARGFFEKAGLTGKIDLLIGEALDIIDGLDETFDLVFIDADKEQYLDYYQAVFPKVKKGGFILADNVLWGGKALEAPKKTDKETSGIRMFNDFLKNDDRVEKVMLTIRDGLYLIRKNS